MRPAVLLLLPLIPLSLAACRSAPPASMPAAPAADAASDIAATASTATAAAHGGGKVSTVPAPVEAAAVTASTAAAAKKGIHDLNVAVFPLPFSRQNLNMLRRVNLTGRLPGKPISPEEFLDIYLNMIRRNFKSATYFEKREDIPPEGYDLHYGLNILLIYGFVSGTKAEVHLTSYIRAPDGELVEHILYDVAKTVPYPATSDMIREAAEEARDLTEEGIRESAKLAEYARTR
ncbi:MAG: hypothetical protein ABII00_18605 [Elusimicrobiota bacterium]